ncbi:ribonuclease H-like domain-containing protein [Tanacetum coccineum]
MWDCQRGKNGRRVRLVSPSRRNIDRVIGKILPFKWKPTGRFFTIVGNSCPLTRITPKKIVHLKETTPKSDDTPKPEIKVDSRRPKQIKSVGLSKKAKIVESNAIDVPSSSFLVNDRLSRSSSGSRDTNLYTISLDDMLKTYPIFLLSKASKTKSWLWNCCLSHLNFAYALGKSKKSSHQPKAEDTNQEKLYLLHMESINGKKYILVIVDDYSRFTWVKFMRSKDESPDAIIKCIKNIQVRLNATVFPVADAPRAIEIADSPVSTSIGQDAPSSNSPSIQDHEHSPIIYQGVEESPKTPLFHDDPLHEFLHKDSTSQGPSSNVRPSHTSFELTGRWTKDHPIANVIDGPS